MGKKVKMKRAGHFIFFFLLLVLTNFALEEREALANKKIAIRAEKIFTVSEGTLTDGLILIEKGKITFVGPSEKIPSDSTLIKAKVVIPGLIDTHTHLGSKSDWNEYANKEFVGDINPTLKIMDVIDQDSPDFAFALSGGVTTVMVTPGSGNLICGELVILKTAGESHQKRVLRNPAGLKMAFDFPQALKMVSDEFEKTQEYLAKKKKANDRGEAFGQDPGLETMARVLKREIPAHIHCIPYYAIENAVKLKKKFGIDVIIEHGLEADKVIKELKESDVPISFGPLLLKQAEGVPDPLPALLDKENIKFSIHSDAPIVPPNALLLYAAQAMKYGLSEAAALRAITLSAAEILEINSRVGSIEVGKDADLVLLDGDPLDIFTHVETVLIDGKIVYSEKDFYGKSK